MRASIKKRLDTLEGSMTNNLYVCVFKGLLPHLAQVHHLDKREKEEPVIFENDDDLDTWLAALPENAQVIILTCENVTGVELHSFGS